MEVVYIEPQALAAVSLHQLMVLLGLSKQVALELLEYVPLFTEVVYI
jgi:hypothetical protein